MLPNRRRQLKRHYIVVIPQLEKRKPVDEPNIVPASYIYGIQVSSFEKRENIEKEEVSYSIKDTDDFELRNYHK